MAQPLPSEHDIPKIFDECEKLKSWLCEDTTEFRNNQGMNECVDTSLDSKIEPLFRKLVRLPQFLPLLSLLIYFRGLKRSQTTVCSI